MKLANLNGRTALITDDGAIDLATVSDGRFGPDVQALYDDWSALTTWVAGVNLPAAAPYDESDLGSPVPQPRQVFAIGLNYRSHAEESGMAVPDVPATFTKFPASLTGPFDDIEIAGPSIDWEVELVAVIAPRADRIDEADA